MKKTIYYFSATGNSLQTALDIGEMLGAEVVSIAKSGMNTDCDSDVIGFVFPTFAWGMPNMVHDFIASGSFNKNAYFFAVVTCGASIGGTAGAVDDLLRKKGAKLSYGVPLKSVSNYIPMYNVNLGKIEETLKKADVELEKIISDISERKSNKIGRGLSLVNYMHRKMSEGSKTEDKHYNVSDACNGCGICASVCPAKNIEMIDGRPAFRHNCEHCISCIHWCPKEAINYKNKTQNRNRYHHPKVKAEQLP